MIPVFFLSMIQGSGQMYWKDASMAACGGSYVSRCGVNNAIHNQAALGWPTEKAVSLQHKRPFMLSDLGFSSMSIQLALGRGSLGSSLSSYGITAYRKSDLWISYGLSLHPGITAGAGIHIWNQSIPGNLIFHPGIGCALGLQVRMGSNWTLGGHILHPLGSILQVQKFESAIMILSVGCSYSFIESFRYHLDLFAQSDAMIQIAQGIELECNDLLNLLLGFHNRPWGLSGGLELNFSTWTIHLAVDYSTETGGTPLSSITHAW